MHQSLIDSIKVHVDDLSEAEKGLKLVGWCGSNELKIKDVRLHSDLGATGSVDFPQKRKDVAESYKSKDFLKSGFEIVFDPDKIEGETKIQALVHDWTDILSLGLLEEKISPKKQQFELDFKKNLTPNAIIVDNFYENPDQVRDFALRQKFLKHEDYHKGQRTEEKFLSEGIKEEFERLLGKKITRWDYGVNGIFQFCTSEDPLVYHTDGQDYAAAIFLTPNAPPECGTNLFRSKINKLQGAPTEKDAERLNRSTEDLFNEIFKTGFYDKTNLELVDKIGNIYNRLAIWNGQLIHSASEYFGNNKTNSRLFQLFFFDIEK